MQTCLIVDDSRVVRKVIRRILEDFEFTCTEVDNGQSAYDICLSAMPDLIMLDWKMPIMSGIEFVEKLRATDGGDAPKVVFCTTENTRTYIERAMAAGADEYIMKPFDREIIHAKLSQVGLVTI